MGEDEPETKDGLGQDIEDSVGDDLGIDAPLTGTITNTPDNGVQSPEKKSESTNGGEQLGGLVVLGGNSTTARDTQLPDNDEVGNTGHGVVSPLLAIGGTEGSEETEENHDQVSNKGDEDAGTVQASEEGKVE